MDDSGGGGIIALLGCGIFAIIYIGIFVLWIAGMWKVFVKAGKPGWAAIVPIYNMIVLLEIIGKPIWWIVLFFVPIVSLVVYVIILVELAKKFGRGIGTAVGLLLLPFVFYPILGFGSAQFEGGGDMQSYSPEA